MPEERGRGFGLWPMGLSFEVSCVADKFLVIVARMDGWICCTNYYTLFCWDLVENCEEWIIVFVFFFFGV